MTNLFRATFDGGDVNAWRFSSASGPAVSGGGWQPGPEADGNWVLGGAGHYWANLATRQNWGDFILRVRVKLVRGGLHLNYRINERGRYFIGFGPGGTSLSKQYFPNTFFPPLAQSAAPNKPGVWHAVEVAGRGGILVVTVDGAQRLAAVDPKPILNGAIAFESLDDSVVQLDDVTVLGRAPPPAPPPDPNLVWVRTGGPLGGIGYDVRIDPTNPQVLYVTDAFSGVSKSVDGGASWAPANEGIVSRAGPTGDAVPVFCLTIDPHRPNVLWAGTQGMRGVYKSTDGAATWSKMDHGIPDLEGITFRSFTVDPVNPEIVYAGTEVPTSRRGPDGQNEAGGKVYKTVDGGRNWSQTMTAGALVRWMAIDPTDTRILYAATGIFDRDDTRSEGILKSTDGGQTWRNINRGLPNLTVGGLVMHPRRPKVLYAATGRHNGFGGGPTAAHGGVYRTDDGGETWTEVLRRPREYFPVTAIALAPSDPDRIYVAPSGNHIHRSRDAGARWEAFSAQPEGASIGIPIAVTVHPTNPEVVYLNSYIGGVFRSGDGGRTWQVTAQGYTGAQTSDVGLDPQHPGTVYAIGRQGIAKSEEGGGQWTYLNRGGAEQFLEGASLSVHPQDARDVLISSRFDGRILRTRDGGKSWNLVAPPLRHTRYPDNLHGLVQFARCARQPDIVFAAGRLAGESAGRASRPRSLGVLKSTDGGESWQAMTNGLPLDLNFSAIAVHPGDPQVAYAGGLYTALYQTTNGGLRWSAVAGVPPDVRAVAISPHNSALVFAGTEGNGLFLSADGGRRWTVGAAGLEPNAAIRAVVCDPSNPRILWVADARSGVYRSMDVGRTWVQINQGLSVRAVNALAISADGRILYAATEGGGVYRLGKLETSKGNASEPARGGAEPQAAASP